MNVPDLTKSQKWCPDTKQDIARFNSPDNDLIYIFLSGYFG